MTANYEKMNLATWLQLSDAEQLEAMRQYGVVGRNPPIGTGKKPTGRKRKDQQQVNVTARPSRREMDEQFDNAPAYPAGPPSDRWSAESLRAYAEHGDAAIAEEAATVVPPLNLNKLTPEHLRAISRCTSREQVALVEQAIRSGASLPAFTTAISEKVRKVRITR